MSRGLATVFMYHRLDSGALPGRETGEEVYAIPPETFEAHLDALEDARSRPLDPARLLQSSDDARSGSAGPVFCLTFDDGNLTDHSTALPLLRRRGWGAAFFIVPAFVGTQGYMSWAEVRELQREGMVVGAHGLDHARLGRLSESELQWQLREARRLLHAELGRAPQALSLPGGSGGRRAVRIAKSEGFAVVATSVPRLADTAAGLAPLPRFALRRGDSPTLVRALAEQQPGVVWRRKARHDILRTLRLLLGDRGYALLRRRWVRSGESGGGRSRVVGHDPRRVVGGGER